MTGRRITTRPTLTEAQRRILLELIAAQAGDSSEEIRLAFEARTGRRLSRSRVHQVRQRSYQEPGTRTLTPLQRATLEGLCLLAPRTDSPATIAEHFEQRTGRRISPGTVNGCLYELGISRKQGVRQ